VPPAAKSSPKAEAKNVAPTIPFGDVNILVIWTGDAGTLAAPEASVGAVVQLTVISCGPAHQTRLLRRRALAASFP
jgi:hypothetical protein